jgi:Tol biopolymer transport system component
MTRHAIGWSLRRLSGIGVRCSVSVACLVCALAATAARGDDARPGADKPASGRIIVRAHTSKEGGPLKDRIVKIGILSIDPETGESKQVGGPEIMGGDLSPDGRFLVIGRGDRGTPDTDICVYDLQANGARKKVSDLTGGALWSNEGRQIVVSHPTAHRKYETYRMNADGTGLMRLPIPETDLVEEISRDGAWLVAYEIPNDGERRARINLMRPDGTERHAVVDEPGMPHSAFRLSPDARRLLYNKITIEPMTFRCALWVVDVDGQNRRQLPIEIEPGTMVYPCWSPDGTRLALGLSWSPTPRNLGRRMDDQIVVVDLDGKNMRTFPAPVPGWRLIPLGWQ